MRYRYGPCPIFLHNTLLSVMNTAEATNPYAGENPYGSAAGAPAASAGAADFFTQLQSLKDDLADYNGLISHLQQLQVSALNSVGLEELENIKAQIANTTANLRTAQSDEIKPKLEALFHSTAGDKDKQNQCENMRAQFQTAIRKFMEVDNVYNQSNLSLAVEQYQIVNPDASYDEAVDFVNQVGDQQVFDEAIAMQNRKGEAMGVLDEVKARHQEMLRTLQQTSELNQLLNDLQGLIFEQDEVFDTVNANVAKAEDKLERGDANVIKARDHAKKGRKWRWILFWVVVILICAIVGGVVGGVVGSRH